MSSVSLSDLSSSEDFQPLDTESESSEVQASEEFDNNSQTQSTRSASPNLISISPSTSLCRIVSTTPSISDKGRHLTSPIHSHGTISESGGSKYWKCTYCKSASNQLTLWQFWWWIQVQWNINWVEGPQSPLAICRNTTQQNLTWESQPLLQLCLG